MLIGGHLHGLMRQVPAASLPLVGEGQGGGLMLMTNASGAK